MKVLKSFFLFLILVICVIGAIAAGIGAFYLKKNYFFNNGPDTMETRPLVFKGAVIEFPPDSIMMSVAEKIEIKKTRKNLDEILHEQYRGARLVVERRAFRNVLRWSGTVDKIMEGYDRIDAAEILAIIKVETQGLNGGQVSSMDAIGLTQIRFQGAWSFFWSALYKKYAHVNGKKERDYYNGSIRTRYAMQLKRIRLFLEDNSILVEPLDETPISIRAAKLKSWERLKQFDKKKRKPGEYHVIVDIAAMYLDHLDFFFTDYSQKIDKIIEKVQTTDMPAFGKIGLDNGARRSWARITKSLKDETIRDFYNMNEGWPSLDEYRKVRPILWSILDNRFVKTGNLDIRQQTLDRLEDVRLWTTDPQVHYAAYYMGPTSVLNNIEAGGGLQKKALRYAENVDNYKGVIARAVAIDEHDDEADRTADETTIALKRDSSTVF